MGNLRTPGGGAFLLDSFKHGQDISMGEGDVVERYRDWRGASGALFCEFGIYSLYSGIRAFRGFFLDGIA